MTKLYTCPKKHKARQETIIQQYRKLFHHSLPLGSQYWTMCASCSDGSNMLEGCELSQLLAENLITESQFNGVDIDEEIIRQNSKAIPRANWYCGDFYRTMINADNRGTLNPGIVNCDHLKMPKEGAEYLARILAFLSKFNNVMFVGNLILRPPRNIKQIKEITGEDMMAKLNECPQFRYAMNSGWKFDNKIYTYNGTGGNYTWLGSMIFYKKG